MLVREAQEDDDEAFDDKMQRLTAQLSKQTERGTELDLPIREKLRRWAGPSCLM